MRWEQRFENYKKALAQLKEAIELSKTRELTKLELQGLVQSFEYTHELAWNTLKDFLEHKGVSNLFGSRDTTKEAFVQGLIENGEMWMKMINSRNLTTHSYDENTVKEITSSVTTEYFGLFEKLEMGLEKLLGQ